MPLLGAAPCGLRIYSPNRCFLCPHEVDRPNLSTVPVAKTPLGMRPGRAVQESSARCFCRGRAGPHSLLHFGKVTGAPGRASDRAWSPLGVWPSALAVSLCPGKPLSNPAPPPLSSPAVWSVLPPGEAAFPDIWKLVS